RDIARAERAHQPRLGRDRFERRVRAVAAVSDPEGEASVTVVAEELPGVRRVEHVMGMPIVVDVRDDDVDEEALDHVFAWFRWVDATFSTYKEDSEISRLGCGELAVEDVSPEVRWVLARCEE